MQHAPVGKHEADQPDSSGELPLTAVLHVDHPCPALKVLFEEGASIGHPQIADALFARLQQPLPGNRDVAAHLAPTAAGCCWEPTRTHHAEIQLLLANGLDVNLVNTGAKLILQTSEGSIVDADFSNNWQMWLRSDCS